MTKLAVVVDPESIVIPKKPANKSASEHRKITKPIMEKKRRARINHSLEQIKDILKENFNECNRKQNIEKADILEMTVKYLKLVTKKSSKKLPLSLDQSNNIQLIENGFQDCKQKINQCLTKINPKMNERLNNHLNKFQQEQLSSMDCDQVLNLSLNDHMIMNNSFMLHTPNSASSTNSYQSIFFPNSPVSERSSSPLCLTVQTNSVWRPW